MMQQHLLIKRAGLELVHILHLLHVLYSRSVLDYFILFHVRLLWIDLKNALRNSNERLCGRWPR